MLPFLTEEDHEALSFKNGDYIFVPNVRKAVEEKADVIKAYVVGDELKELNLKLGDLTDAEREIILDGCLINYYRNHQSIINYDKMKEKRRDMGNDLYLAVFILLIKFSHASIKTK